MFGHVALGAEVVGGGPAGGRRVDPVGVHRHDRLDVLGVGELGPVRWGRRGRRAAGEHHVGAEGGQPPLEHRGDRPGHLVLGGAVGCGEPGQLGAVPGVDHDAGAGEGGPACGTAELFALPDGVGRRGLVGAVQPLEQVERPGAGDAVDLETDVELELADRVEGLGAVDAVVVPGVEPEPVEATLQVAHVVADERRTGDVQHPVAEPVAGRHEGAPGIGTDDPVGLAGHAAAGRLGPPRRSHRRTVRSRRGRR